MEENKELILPGFVHAQELDKNTTIADIISPQMLIDDIILASLASVPDSFIY